MKNYFLLVIFCFSVFTCNQGLAAPLWNNEKDKGDDYLLGTIHIGDHRLNKLPDVIKKAIDEVEVVVLEVDMRTVTAMEQQKVVMKVGLLPIGTSLKKQLSPQVYQRVEQYLLKNGANIAVMQQFKPWMVALTMVQMAYARQGFTAEKGVDQQVMTYAEQTGKKIVGLETFSEQMSFFEQLFEQNPHLNSDDLILDTLNELEHYSELPDVMMKAWLEADMDKFEAIYEKTLNASSFDRAAEKILLSGRNKNWLPKLEHLIKEKSVLIAVGTLHFTGPDSLQKLLTESFSN